MFFVVTRFNDSSKSVNISIIGLTSTIEEARSLIFSCIKENELDTLGSSGYNSLEEIPEKYRPYAFFHDGYYRHIMEEIHIEKVHETQFVSCECLEAFSNKDSKIIYTISNPPLHSVIPPITEKEVNGIYYREGMDSELKRK